ncbi:TonB C-terminal domain-containing protein [Burkholderia sp. R-70006]|nr:TonB C-terminal domain-containing protein [Burkholderia sp. R-70006]
MRCLTISRFVSRNWPFVTRLPAQTGNRLPSRRNSTFFVLRTDAVRSFAKKLRQRIRPNIVWDGKDRNLQTIIAVRSEPDGRLLEATIAQSSGNPEWDSAALQAVLRSDPLPADDDGKTPAKLRLTIRPGPD